MKIHYVYMTEHLPTGKFYIGGHYGNPEDNYLGSGVKIKEMLKKYPREEFKKTIILKSTQKTVSDYEKHLIERNIDHPDCLNLYRGGHNCTKETRIKLSRNHADVRGENHPLYGKNHSDEAKAKIGKSLKGKIISKKTKAKMSRSKLGEGNPMYGKRGEETSRYGKKHSDEAKAKMSKAQSGKNNHMYGKKQKQIVCPHCGKIGGYVTMQRWHFDRCKFKST